MTVKIRDASIFGVILAFSFFLYWGCREASFIWDDQFLVVKNPLIRSPILGLEIFRHFLGEEPASNFYRPVQTITYLINYWWGGLRVASYHDGNMLLHGLNGILFFVFIRCLLRRQKQISESAATFASFLTATLWLVHPIFSATVAYIAGRADSLALFFMLGAWCFWERYKTAGRKNRWIFVTLIFLSGFLAICSKEAALIGIAVFLLSVLLLDKRTSLPEKKAVLFGSLVLLGLYLALRLSISSPEENVGAATAFGNRFVLVLRALGDYFRLLIFPGNLRMERQIVMVPNLFRDPATFDPLFPYLIIPGLVFLAILIFATIKKGFLLEVRRFGVLWFVATILPVSNLLKLNATVAEHWLYIPSIGFFIMVTGWLLETSKPIRTTAGILAILAIVALTVRTKERVKDWASPIAFFEATIRDGGDTARMRVNLANEYQLHGQLSKGETLLRSVLVLSPDYAQARHALFVNLIQQGKRKDANLLFGKQEAPYGSSFRGRLYAVDQMISQNQLEKAASSLNKMREEDANSWLLIKEIGLFLDKMGQSMEKITLYRSFADNHWWHAESHVELGKLYESDNQWKAAAEMYHEASRLDIHDRALKERAAKLLQNESVPIR